MELSANQRQQLDYVLRAKTAVDAAETRLTKAVNRAIERGCTYEQVAQVLGVGRTTVWRNHRWTQQRLDV